MAERITNLIKFVFENKLFPLNKIRAHRKKIWLVLTTYYLLAFMEMVFWKSVLFFFFKMLTVRPCKYSILICLTLEDLKDYAIKAVSKNDQI